MPPRLLLLAAPLALGATQAPQPRLVPRQELALHCSAVFAVVAADQARQAPEMRGLPALGRRGREYFVVTFARLMDETGATRDVVSMLVRQQVATIRDDLRRSADPALEMHRQVDACLPLLDAEVPPSQ